MRGDALIRTCITLLALSSWPLAKSQEPVAKSRILLFEVRAHHREIIFSQATNDFPLEILAARCRGAAIALRICGAALLDVFLQAIVQIFVAAAFVALALTLVILSRPAR